MNRPRPSAKPRPPCKATPRHPPCAPSPEREQAPPPGGGGRSLRARRGGRGRRARASPASGASAARPHGAGPAPRMRQPPRPAPRGEEQKPLPPPSRASQLAPPRRPPCCQATLGSCQPLACPPSSAFLIGRGHHGRPIGAGVVAGWGHQNQKAGGQAGVREGGTGGEGCWRPLTGRCRAEGVSGTLRCVRDPPRPGHPPTGGRARAAGQRRPHVLRVPAAAAPLGDVGTDSLGTLRGLVKPPEP